MHSVDSSSKFALNTKRSLPKHEIDAIRTEGRRLWSAGFGNDKISSDQRYKQHTTYGDSYCVKPIHDKIVGRNSMLGHEQRNRPQPIKLFPSEGLSNAAQGFPAPRTVVSHRPNTINHPPQPRYNYREDKYATSNYQKLQRSRPLEKKVLESVMQPDYVQHAVEWLDNADKNNRRIVLEMLTKSSTGIHTTASRPMKTDNYRPIGNGESDGQKSNRFVRFEKTPKRGKSRQLQTTDRYLMTGYHNSR